MSFWNGNSRASWTWTHRFFPPLKFGIKTPEFKLSLDSGIRRIGQWVWSELEFEKRCFRSGTLALSSKISVSNPSVERFRGASMYFGETLNWSSAQIKSFHLVLDFERLQSLHYHLNPLESISEPLGKSIRNTWIWSQRSDVETNRRFRCELKPGFVTSCLVLANKTDYERSAELLWFQKGVCFKTILVTLPFQWCNVGRGGRRTSVAECVAFQWNDPIRRTSREIPIGVLDSRAAAELATLMQYRFRSN